MAGAGPAGPFHPVPVAAWLRGAPALGSGGHPASPPAHAPLRLGWLERFCQR